MNHPLDVAIVHPKTHILIFTNGARYDITNPKKVKPLKSVKPFEVTPDTLPNEYSEYLYLGIAAIHEGSFEN